MTDAEIIEELTKVVAYYAYEGTWDFGYYARQVLLDISGKPKDGDFHEAREL